ncbi:MAG: hypothetical protein QOD77_296 [Thermoplasmata archaeon]|jgi:hypothetical protein|nr:hypothetical protein [Thermoplasmata archaeon]
MRTLPLLAAALVALTALAGCGDTIDPPVLPPPPPPAAKPFVRVEAPVAKGDSGAEPSLGVAPDGTLYTNLFSNVYQSKDSGATWTNLGDPYPGIPNNDPDLAVDVDGTVWESRLYAAVCNAVSVSKDAGATWTNNPAVCAGPVHDRQYVIPTTGGTAYLYSHQLPSFQQLALKTTDYGATWLPTAPPEGAGNVIFATGNSGWGGGGFWNQAKDSVWFTFNFADGVATGGGAHAAYAMTSDGGQAWTLGFAGDLAGQQLGLGLVTGAADDAGNVYLAWGEADGDKVSIFLAGSKDEGATWQARRMDDATGSKVFPIAVAGADGHAAVAFYEAGEDAFPDNVQGDWNVTLAWTTDFFGNGTVSQGQLNSEPVKTGGICISGTTCTGDREFADYFDAVRMPDGRVGVTYNVLRSGALGNAFSLTEEPLLGAKPAA